MHPSDSAEVFFWLQLCTWYVWRRQEWIAAAASFFILVNSCAGLIGQWSKLGVLEIRGDLNAYLWLFPAVLIGGQLGSRAGIRVFSPKTVRQLTAALVFIVGGRLLFRWYTSA